MWVDGHDSPPPRRPDATEPEQPRYAYRPPALKASMLERAYVFRWVGKHRARKPVRRHRLAAPPKRAMFADFPYFLAGLLVVLVIALGYGVVSMALTGPVIDMSEAVK